MEADEFSAFQTNAAAAFLVGSLRIPPLGILDANDTSGRRSDTTARRTGEKQGREPRQHRLLQKDPQNIQYVYGIRCDVAKHADVHAPTHGRALENECVKKKKSGQTDVVSQIPALTVAPVPFCGNDKRSMQTL